MTLYVLSKDENRKPNDLEHVRYEYWDLDTFLDALVAQKLQIHTQNVYYFDLKYTTAAVYNEFSRIFGKVELHFYKFVDDVEYFEVPEEHKSKIVYHDYTPISQSKVIEPSSEPSAEVKLEPDDYENETAEPEVRIPSSGASTKVKLEESSEASVKGNFIEDDVDVNAFDLDKDKIITSFELSEEEETSPKKQAKAKIIVFGSSKGGAGKTTTCLMSAYRYAKTHPNKKIALIDLDIEDGQISTILDTYAAPTLLQYYQQYTKGINTFNAFNAYAVKHEKFTPNIDFYLPPHTEVDEITNNDKFWMNVISHAVDNYDVVFFDTGTGYVSKPPIVAAYKLADRIVLCSNPSRLSVRSVIKQLMVLSGQRKTGAYGKSNLLKKVKLVLTRMYDNPEINDIVITKLGEYAEIVALFGNMDNVISAIQYFQKWQLIDGNKALSAALSNIVGEIV